LSLRKVSAPKGIEFGKLTMNINLADVETAKIEQALLLRQEEEKTILSKESTGI